MFMDPKEAKTERESIQEEFNKLQQEIKTLGEQRKAFLSNIDTKTETAKIRIQQLQGAFQLIEKMCPKEQAKPIPIKK